MQVCADHCPASKPSSRRSNSMKCQEPIERRPWPKDGKIKLCSPHLIQHDFLKRFTCGNDFVFKTARFHGSLDFLENDSKEIKSTLLFLGPTFLVLLAIGCLPAKPKGPSPVSEVGGSREGKPDMGSNKARPI